MRCYNDQPSDCIHCQGLAHAAPGHPEKAKKSCHQLIIFGQQHSFDQVDYDCFAVPQPERRRVRITSSSAATMTAAA